MKLNRFYSISVLVGIVLSLGLFLLWSRPAYALDYYDYIQLGITPIPCSGSTDSISQCPVTRITPAVSSDAHLSELRTFYSHSSYQGSFGRGNSDECAIKYEPVCSPAPCTDPLASQAFTTDPRRMHFWAEDPEITALGKSADRSRQFIFWALTHGAVDQALPLKQIWAMNRNIAFSLMMLVTAILGIAIVVANRLKSGYKFSLQSSILKILLSVLYIAFSASIVLTIISLSDILMRFFIETLGGDRVFNTFFGATSDESNYVNFVGCRDLNIRVREGAEAEMFLIKLSNITHYMMGVMLILRKVILWFLLFVSPFLPLLLSFPLIRNTGKIWIGVFFQWIFYGPLFALFFGATSKLFFDGIPFLFDFSRIEKAIGYVFPTAIIITYGGPAQKLNGLNNGNYIDTFAEYIITLVLWWAATWFPWWLLRIFRDDCCDGIYAIRNALYSYMDKPTKPVGPIAPLPTKPPSFDAPPEEPLKTKPRTSGRDEKITTIRLDNVNMVRQAQTKEIATALKLQTSRLTDVAHLETNKESMRIAKVNFALLANPLSAQTATERQKYLNLRTELFTRATTKNDAMAQYLLTATNRTSQTYIAQRNEIAKSIRSVVGNIDTHKVIDLAQSTSTTTHISADKVISITNSTLNTIVNNQTALETISQGAHVTVERAKQVLQSYASQIGQPFNTIVTRIADSLTTEKETVKNVLKETQSLIARSRATQQISRVVSADVAHVALVMDQITHLITTAASASVDTVAQKTKTAGNQIVSKISEVALSVVAKEPAVLSRIERSTNATTQNIMDVLHTVSEKGIYALAQVQQRAQLSRDQVRDILMECARIVETQRSTTITSPVGTPLDEVVRTTLESQTSQETQLEKFFSEKSIALFTKKILMRLKSDATLISTIQQTVSLSKKQIEETLHILSQAPSIVSADTLDKIYHVVGVQATQALLIVKEAIRFAKTSQEALTPMQGSTLTETALILQEQLETVLHPELQVDQSLPLPEDDASLAEYQEIRELWVKQYREGEVPLSETVHSREEWVEQDITLITSILVRLMSEEEMVRQQALDEIGFILPVFLMNNLTGAQLLTYLKAKVSAAKEVRVELAQKSIEDEGELVEVERLSRPAEENAKHMEVDETGEAITAEQT